jgi:F-type H+-transporting ATPase subunit epsilon
MTRFKLEIITPQRKAFDEEVDAVHVPTPDGTIEVLAHHVPLFTSLKEGELKVTTGTKEYFLAIGGGFMEVQPNGIVTILVSRAVHANEINEAELKKALDNAKSLIARKVKGEELTQALMAMHRSMLELKVVRRKHAPTPFGAAH